MAYDLVRQRYPGAPCAIGARVREIGSGREGRIQQPRMGRDGVCVAFEGSWPPVVVEPRSIEYAAAPVIALRGERA